MREEESIKILFIFMGRKILQAYLFCLSTQRPGNRCPLKWEPPKIVFHSEISVVLINS